MPNRRELLRTGAQVTAGGLVAGLIGGEAASAGTGARPDSAARHELARMLSPGARLMWPGQQEFAHVATPWNLRYADRRPAVIVCAATVKDVQAALRWAAKHGVPLAPRSGGHNYAGYSTTRGLLIDLKKLHNVIRRGAKLWVEGGATNSDVYRAGKSRTGLYFPGGRCAGVGVAGLALGGGLGFNDRKWGLTCDRLVETEIVLADGTRVRAGESQNADLFWAVRGGAGNNFGVNTGFLFEAVPVDRQVSTTFNLSFYPHQGVEVMKTLQELLGEDRRGDLDVRIAFHNPGTKPEDSEIAVLGQYLGTQKVVERLLRPLVELKPVKHTINESDFWTAQQHLGLEGEREAMASKSLVPDHWLEDGLVTNLVDWLLDWRPGTRGDRAYVTLFAMGGRIAEVGQTETAFPHREAKFVIDVGSSWAPNSSKDDVDFILGQLGAIYGRLKDGLQTAAAYVNFPDPALNDWQTAYYGDNYYRLVQVKKHYDRDRVFHYPQAIGG